MRRIVLLTVLLVFALSAGMAGAAYAASTWNQIGTYPETTLASMDFADPLNGWVISGDGRLFHTTDGGGTWETLQSGWTASAVRSRSASEVLAGGFGYLGRSVDGGTTWRQARIYGFIGTPQVYQPTFVDDLNGHFYARWSAGGWWDGTFYTSDGGRTWTSPQYYGSGFVFETWDPSPLPISAAMTPPGILNGSIYRSTMPITWVGDEGWSYGDGNPQVAHTCDGGITWDYVILGNQVASVVALDRDHLFATTIDGGYVHTSFMYSTSTGGQTLHVASLAGGDRFQTSVFESRHAFPSAVTTVVVATGRNWPDALGASALAGARGAPLLLTDTKTLPSSVKGEISRLKAKDVIVLGGPSTVATDVLTTLKTVASGEVTRVAGGDRFATAAKVASLAVADTKSDGTVYVATGRNFADALAVSPVAAAFGRPVLLTEPSRLPPVTSAALAAMDPSRVFILGGTSAVSTDVVTEVRTACPSAVVERLSGDDRYLTSLEVAAHAVDEGLSWDTVALANGAGFPDALGGGVMQGALRGPLLLTPKTYLHAGVATQLAERSASVRHVAFLGGETALQAPVRSAVRSALGD